MRRRRAVALAGLGLAVVGAGATAAWSARLVPGSASAAESAPPSQGPTPRTATIERRTLQVSEELDGTLGYDGELEVAAHLPGTITWLPAEGSVIKRGGRLYEVDGRQRAVLLTGSRPAWRTMRSGVDDGADIRQLERNLKALGFGHGLTVDGHWNSQTTAAVKRWQKRSGLKVDGVVDLGEVVFLPTALRVTERVAALGSPAGGIVLRGSSPNRVVTLELEADNQDLVETGMAVTIELPDGTTVQGHVTKIGRVAHPGEQTGIPGDTSPATIDVTIKLDDDSAAGSLDQAPVTVNAVTNAHENVLAVPVNALVALLEGGYAVEVVNPDGSHRYVGVRPGLFADGWVEVTGTGLEAGQKIVVPS